jgi:hypothetical protein
MVALRWWVGREEALLKATGGGSRLQRRELCFEPGANGRVARAREEVGALERIGREVVERPSASPESEAPSEQPTTAPEPSTTRER